MRYTLKDMQAQFPNDDICLQAIFDRRYGNLKACPNCGIDSPKFYRIKYRKSFVCKECRYHIYPLAGTIFEKTTTPLTDWFHVLYLFSVSKHGVSAKEIERQVRVSYKTAHRLAKQVRKLMTDDTDILGGHGRVVQSDEAWIGGKRKQSRVKDNKTPLVALQEVGGNLKTAVMSRAIATTVMPYLLANVHEGSILHTDESKIYKTAKRYYQHGSVRHISKKYVENGVTTNHVEGFFSNFKRSLLSTHSAVSPRYLSSYASEFAFRLNHRSEAIFPLLLARVAKHD